MEREQGVELQKELVDAGFEVSLIGTPVPERLHTPVWRLEVRTKDAETKELGDLLIRFDRLGFDVRINPLGRVEVR